MLSEPQVLLDALGDGESAYVLGASLAQESVAHGFGLLEVRESGGLPGDDIAGRSASAYPDLAVALHPKLTLLLGDAAPIDGASWGVALEED